MFNAPAYLLFLAFFFNWSGRSSDIYLGHRTNEMSFLLNFTHLICVYSLLFVKNLYTRSEGNNGVVISLQTNFAFFWLNSDYCQVKDSHHTFHHATSIAWLAISNTYENSAIPRTTQFGFHIPVSECFNWNISNSINIQKAWVGDSPYSFNAMKLIGMV